jgi:protein phosphatase
MVLTWAAGTAVGWQRTRNEDAWFAGARSEEAGGLPSRGVFVVSDGMGGHEGGDWASTLAVRVLEDRLAWVLDGEWPEAAILPGRVRAAVLAANAAIYTRNLQEGRVGRGRAGATVSLLLVSGRNACVAHAGDSRVGRVEAGGFRWITTDHNVGNLEIALGRRPDEVWRRVEARYLTQVLGPEGSDRLQPEVSLLPTGRDTLFLLCSDGLSDRGFVERHEATLLRPLVEPEADLEAGCRALIAAGEAANGHDNLTAILVRVLG